MSKVTIVILSYNQWAMTHQLLLDIYKKEMGNVDKVIVVDNGSTDEEVVDGLKWWKKDMSLPVVPLVLEQNVGFLMGANAGLEYALNLPDTNPEDMIVLLSNDVRVQSEFIFQSKSILWENPMTLIGGVVYTHDTGWNKFNDKIFPYAEGWLLATKAENWRELGLFDVQYAPNDFEDVDLSTKAVSLGYQLVALNNPGIRHLGGQTLGYNPARADQTRINQKKFEARWIK